MRALNLKQALAIIDAAFQEGARLNCRPLTAVVLDAGGHVKAAQKQDGSAMLRFEIAYGKANAALSMGRSSMMVLQKHREKPAFMDCLLKMASGPMFLEGGGQLIRDEVGEVFGAIGVTGDVAKLDDECAIAGIRAAGLRADVDFQDPDDIHRMNIKL